MAHATQLRNPAKPPPQESSRGGVAQPQDERGEVQPGPVAADELVEPRCDRPELLGTPEERKAFDA